jgi:hypothetical protein
METHGATIKLKDSVREAINADGAVLLDIEQGRCLSLNSVGAKLWAMIKEGRSLDQVAESLEKEYGVSRQIVSQDISDFVGKLEANRLIANGNPNDKKTGLLARLFGKR